MKIHEIITELRLPKDKWLSLGQTEKHQASDDLISNVATAYKGTNLGSFVKDVGDVAASEWEVIDWDHEPDVDASIFYRKSRSTESWTGKKIQGIGHDGSSISKNKVLKQLEQMLNTNGTWIEANGSLRKRLLQMSVPVVTDVELLERLFNSTVTKVSDTEYQRRDSSGVFIETVFGKPTLK